MRRAPTAQPALPADLKLGNRMQVMEVFKTGGEYTANAISEQIGLSRQTVMKAMQFFVDKGFQLTANPVEAHYFIKLNGRFKDRATPGNAKSAGTMLDLGIQVESVDGSRTLLTII